jgi:hypothetical protein
VESPFVCKRPKSQLCSSELDNFSSGIGYFMISETARFD